MSLWSDSRWSFSVNVAWEDYAVGKGREEPAWFVLGMKLAAKLLVYR